MNFYLHTQAMEAIDRIRPFASMGGEPQSLAQHFDDVIDELIEQFHADFEIWQMTFNVVQDWFTQNHPRFEGMRHMVSSDSPMDGELPLCMNPLFWRTYGKKYVLKG